MINEMSTALPVCCGQPTVVMHGFECDYTECMICHAQYDKCNTCGQYSDAPCDHGVCNMCTSHDLYDMGFVYDPEYTHHHGHHWRYTRCDLMGCTLDSDDLPLGDIIRSTDSDHPSHVQALLLTTRYHFRHDSRLCKTCFWK